MFNKENFNNAVGVVLDGMKRINKQSMKSPEGVNSGFKVRIEGSMSLDKDMDIGANATLENQAMKDYINAGGKISAKVLRELKREATFQVEAYYRVGEEIAVDFAGDDEDTDNE